MKPVLGTLLASMLLVACGGGGGGATSLFGLLGLFGLLLAFRRPKVLH